MYPQANIANNPDFLNFLLQQRLGQKGAGQGQAMPPPPAPPPAPNLAQQRLGNGVGISDAPPQPMRSVAPSLVDERLAYAGGTPAPASNNLPVSSLPSPSSPSPYTPMPQYSRSHQHGEKMGFGQRILHSLKSGGLGFLRGGVGGAAAGLIGGAVDPEFWHRAKYQYQTLPLWQQRFQNESAIADQKRQDLGAERQQDNFNRQMTNDEVRNNNITTDNHLAAMRESRVSAEAEIARKRQEQQDQFQHGKSLADQRRDLTKDSGEFAASPSELMFGDSVKNRGNIIPALDNKGFFRQPSTQQEQERKLAVAEAMGGARVANQVEAQRLLAPGEMDAFERKEQIRNKYNPDPNAHTQKEVDAATIDYKSKLRQAETLIEQATRSEQQAKELDAKKDKTPEEVKTMTKLGEEAKDAYRKAELLRAEGRSKKREVRTWKVRGSGAASSSSSKTPRTISQSTYDEMVKDAAAGDKDAIAAVEAIKSGKYTVK
jgi:hypothetical protein